jgi:hypothetical protein
MGPCADKLAYRGTRTYMSPAGILASILIPWALFTAVLFDLSFDMHYNMPALAWALAFVGLLVVATIAQMACLRPGTAGLDHALTGHFYESMTAKVLVVTSFSAWVAATVLAQSNYAQSMQAYYTLSNLNSYSDVDVLMSGTTAMDSGWLTFRSGTFIDASKAHGFKNDDVYCVAPLTREGATSDSYDYWVVGLNCCNGGTGDFHCAAPSASDSPGGLRVVDDNLLGFYSLAVKQTAANLGLKAEHPIFLTWESQPEARLEQIREDGLRTFCSWSLMFLTIQVIFVTVQAYAFAKVAWI